jgi:hypothetical protein
LLLDRPSRELFVTAPGDESVNVHKVGAKQFSLENIISLLLLNTSSKSIAIFKCVAFLTFPAVFVKSLYR